MSRQNVYYTKEGFEKIKRELRQLEEKEMPHIATQIGEASAKGDLSENAEYHAAKNRQRIVSMQIREIKQEMASAVVLDPKQVDTSQVSILTTVEIEDQDTQRKSVYTLVSEREADMKSRKLSVSSPLGRGLLGKKVGQIVPIEMPSPNPRAGGHQKRSFKVLSINV